MSMCRRVSVSVTVSFGLMRQNVCVDEAKCVCRGVEMSAGGEGMYVHTRVGMKND